MRIPSNHCPRTLGRYNGFFNINGGFQSGSSDFREQRSGTRFGEPETIDATHESSSGALIDVSGGVRVWRNLAIGGGFSRMSDSDRVVVTAQIPNPLFFDRPRAATAQRGDLTHSERAVHISATWLLPVAEKADIALSVGPTFFSLRQEVITGIALGSEAGPLFDRIEIASLQTQTVSETGVGVNAGFDFTYMITERIGGGFFLRYAGGSVDVGDASVDVGGFQTGVGLRVRF